MKTIAWLIIALMLLGNATAFTIADYPDFFFKNNEFTANIIKSETRDSAQSVANSLLIADLHKAMAARHIKPQALTSQKRDWGDEIVIGTPCANHRIREILNVKGSRCFTAFKQPQGRIMLTQGKNTTLVITGSSSSMVLQSVKALLDPKQRSKMQDTNVTIQPPISQWFTLPASRRFLRIGQTIGYG